MAKARIGHFMEARVLEALEVDYIDESEVLTPADEANHIDKWEFKAPFVCGATNLGEALRRIGEGAAMIRSKGEAGTGDIVEAVRHMRQIRGEIRRLTCSAPTRAATAAKELAGAARPRAPGGRATAGCRCVVLCGRDRHAGGRGADDGARRRGRVRRLGDLQVRRPAAAPGRSSRRRRIGRTPSASPRPHAALARRWKPGDLEARGRAAARPARLVTRRGADAACGDAHWSACSRCRAASRRTSAFCGGLGRRARGAGACRPRGSRRVGGAGRRVDDDDARDRARGARRAARRAGGCGHPDPRVLRRDDHARPRAPRG